MEKRRIFIDNQETQYFIYEDGRVYSEHSSRLLTPNLSRGYLKVSISLNGKVYTKYIHKLVAENFLTKIDGYEINHKDGDKMNNHVDNLEWISKSENIKHAYKLGLATASIEQIKRPVIQIDKDSGEIIKEFETAREAAIELGNQNKAPNITRVCQGKRETAYGFKWEYKDGRKDKKWNEL